MQLPYLTVRTNMAEGGRVSMAVTFRNAITGDRTSVDPQPGKTVKQAVQAAGLVAPGNAFSVRDMSGKVVDDEPVDRYDGEVLSVGLPTDLIVGGTGG